MFFYTLGVEEVDYSLYPKREHQLKFIAVYLEEAAKLKGTVWPGVMQLPPWFSLKLFLTFSIYIIQCHFGVNWLWVSKINIYYCKSSFNPTPSNEPPRVRQNLCPIVRDG